MKRHLGCESSERRRRLLDPSNGVNGIDYLEVLDAETPPGFERQRLLVIRCFKSVGGLSRDNVRIDGGVRREEIDVLFAHPLRAFVEGSVPATDVDPSLQPGVALAGQRFLLGGAVNPSSSSSSSGASELDRFLIVFTSSDGDFSHYLLTLRDATSGEPLPGFDPLASRVTFTFKAECSTDLDCRDDRPCDEPAGRELKIDYLAKDYESFRRLMLDRLAVTLPDWRERNPADLGVTVVEALAYAADQVSYAQDAIGTEAYLGTARRRVSVARHARLLGYRPYPGQSARTLLSVTVAPGSSLDGESLKAHTEVLTQPLRDSQAGLETVFNTLTAIELSSFLNDIPLWLWGAEFDESPDAGGCCIPRGARSLALDNSGDRLRVLAGRRYPFLIFADRRDPELRHAVLLTRLEFTEDPLFTELGGGPQRVLKVEWSDEDAFPFTLPLEVTKVTSGRQTNVAVLGNVVLSEHGRLEHLPRLKALWVRSGNPQNRYAAELPLGPVSRSAPLPQLESEGAGSTVVFSSGNEFVSTHDLLERKVARPLPRVEVKSVASGNPWAFRADLLKSGRFERQFTIEDDDHQRATLRFGAPMTDAEAELEVGYHVGCGRAGCVGRDALTRFKPELPGLGVTNPLAARGGFEEEPIDHVRTAAPAAFRRQRRAVTPEDYAARAGEFKDVQRAVATRRWTGSFHTVFISVDRRGGRPVGPEFERDLRRFLEPFRLAGEDLEIEPPNFVSLDIGLTICVEEGHSRSRVLGALTERFSSRRTSGGRLGFFHPDRFTFRQDVFLSQLLEAVAQVPGVAFVDIGRHAPLRRFQRLARAPNGELEKGVLRIGRSEIARADSDPSRPENGRVEFLLKGGR